MRKFLLIAAGLGIVGAANADIIANWTFETTIPTTAGPFNPEVGVGSLMGSHAGTSTYSSPSGNGSTHAFSSNGWAVGDFYQAKVSTVGLTGVNFTFDQNGSNTGPINFRLDYSTDGTSFSTFANYSVATNGSTAIVWTAATNNPVSTKSFDMSGVTALDNASSVYLRLVNVDTASINGGTVGSSGTDRIDNVIVSATAAVPEPATMAVLGLGVIGLVRRRRTK